ncbi:serine/threonine-protein kinase [Streptomyces sp. NPDC059396]|uniref:serine/threonine-protein kinase n=1 Tax=Streptomyces sp. NPDC059396 TaxID=3346819 RepID=UPI003688961F
MTAEGGDLVAGRYLLEERIGAGGMGVVWRAYDSKLDRPVAVKCARVDDARLVKRLMSEARIAARLHHPHIVSVFDRIDEIDKGAGCWLVLEYVPSRSLAQIMAADGPLAPERVAAIGRQIAGALAAAHAKGVVHGDVTPENILITEDGRTGGVVGALDGIAKLTDFGIARALWSDAGHSLSGGVPGKPRYIAPEVARGGPLSREADLFSLGATLFAAVEGHSPYGQADGAIAYLGRAIEGRVEAPRRAGALTRLLTELLQKDPEGRPTAVRARELLGEIAPELGRAGGGGAGRPRRRAVRGGPYGSRAGVRSSARGWWWHWQLRWWPGCCCTGRTPGGAPPPGTALPGTPPLGTATSRARRSGPWAMRVPPIPAPCSTPPRSTGSAGPN